MIDLDFIRKTMKYIRWGVILPIAGLNMRNLVYNRKGELKADEIERINKALLESNIIIIKALN